VRIKRTPLTVLARPDVANRTRAERRAAQRKARRILKKQRKAGEQSP
jgi:hypothetical protein